MTGIVNTAKPIKSCIEIPRPITIMHRIALNATETKGVAKSIPQLTLFRKRNLISARITSTTNNPAPLQASVIVPNRPSERKNVRPMHLSPNARPFITHTVASAKYDDKYSIKSFICLPPMRLDLWQARHGNVLCSHPIAHLALIHRQCHPKYSAHFHPRPSP